MGSKEIDARIIEIMDEIVTLSKEYVLFKKIKDLNTTKKYCKREFMKNI